MKNKTLWLMVITICLLLLPGAALSEEDKFSGFVILKNDFKFPQAADKKEYMFQRLNLYARQKLFGAGLDVDYAHKLDCIRFRLYTTINFDPLYFTFGYQSMSFQTIATSHVQTGIGATKSFEGWNGFFDVRNYWGIDRKSDGFLELWSGLYRKIGGNWFVGSELGYVHWWQREPHNWILAGPVFGYQITKEVSASIRFARTWDIKEDKRVTENEIQFRLNRYF